MFSIVMPLKSLDIEGLEQRIEYILKFLEPQNIIIITHKENFLTKFATRFQDKIIFEDENRLIPTLNLNAVKNYISKKAKNSKHYEKCLLRSGWYFQQFLKMGYARVTKMFNKEIANKEDCRWVGGGYIVWDSDILPLQKIDFFSISKDCKNTTEFKALFNYGTETHKPYFRTMQTLLPDLKKRVNVSFIAEYMPIDAVKMCELLDNIEMAHKKPFWQAILESISLEDLAFSGFSEFETYGNFLALYYPQSFSFKKRRYDRFAKEIIGANPSSRQLKWYGKYYEIIGFESWSKTNTMALKLSKNPFICAIFSPKGLRKLLKIKYKPF